MQEQKYQTPVYYVVDNVIFQNTDSSAHMPLSMDVSLWED